MAFRFSHPTNLIVKGLQPTSLWKSVNAFYSISHFGRVFSSRSLMLYQLSQGRCIQNMSQYLGLRRNRVPPYEPRYTGDAPKYKSKFPYFGKRAIPKRTATIFRYSIPAQNISNAKILIEYTFPTAQLASQIRRQLSRTLCGASIACAGRVGGERTDMMRGTDHHFLMITRIDDGAVLFNSESYSEGS